MADEPAPTPAPPTPPPVPGSSFLDQLAPHALKIMIGAAVVGLISCFLPAVTVSTDASLEALGVRGSASSEGVWKDWRGVMCLLGYLGVGGMAGLMLSKPQPAARQLSLACLIAGGVVVLMAFLLILATSGGNDLSGLGIKVSRGFGPYLNLIASFVLTGGAVLQAKKEKLL